MLNDFSYELLFMRAVFLYYILCTTRIRESTILLKIKPYTVHVSDAAPQQSNVQLT